MCCCGVGRAATVSRSCSRTGVTFFLSSSGHFDAADSRRRCASSRPPKTMPEVASSCSEEVLVQSARRSGRARRGRAAEGYHRIYVCAASSTASVAMKLGLQ